ncbi:hypothetical protein OPQ81_010498 [Rhizoctonia solani]|nr:hypothetical protein OPQ81_010498 [Rhizoctonia solani]
MWYHSVGALVTVKFDSSNLIFVDETKNVSIDTPQVGAVFVTSCSTATLWLEAPYASLLVRAILLVLDEDQFP